MISLHTLWGDIHFIYIEIADIILDIFSAFSNEFYFLFLWEIRAMNIKMMAFHWILHQYKQVVGIQ